MEARVLKTPMDSLYDNINLSNDDAILELTSTVFENDWNFLFPRWSLLQKTTILCTLMDEMNIFMDDLVGTSFQELMTNRDCKMDTDDLFEIEIQIATLQFMLSKEIENKTEFNRNIMKSTLYTQQEKKEMNQKLIDLKAMEKIVCIKGKKKMNTEIIKNQDLYKELPSFKKLIHPLDLHDE